MKSKSRTDRAISITKYNKEMCCSSRNVN